LEVHALASLQKVLSPHIPLGKTRLETLCLLILGMIATRTVNLSHIAAERPGRAQVASTYRRLQRFFQHVRLPEDWSAPIVTTLIGHSASWYLCLDRTNWKIGRSNVNVLMLAVVTRRFRVPLMWSVLEKAGSSSTAERVALMERYLARYGAASIRMLLADREFIGQEWLGFLCASGIPFTIRVKEEQIVELPDGRRVALRSLLRKCRGCRSFQATFPARDGHPALALQSAAKRGRHGERLIVASTMKGTGVLNVYRKRWAVECLFGDAKTRGLNLEDTRLTIAHKLCLLLSVLALAVAWICRTASALMGRRNPPRKTHGYYAKSWFRIGFDELRRRLRNCPRDAVGPLEKHLGKARVV